MNKLCNSPDYEHKQRTPLDTIRFQTRNTCEKRKEGVFFFSPNSETCK